MRLREIGELPLLERIRARFSVKSGSVLAGMGDDAAILKGDSRKLLATTDMMVEGVHFDLGFTTPYQAGFKLVSANVSDIYAMGGKPRFALLALAAPEDTEESFVDGLLDGMEEAFGLHGVALVGGDLSATKGKITLSLTVLGYAERPLKRSGAKPGDAIYVTGSLGESACGLMLLKLINRPVDLERPLEGPLKWEVMEPLLRRHLMPEARKPGSFVKLATSMIDLSDGLFIDLRRLCAESGVGARLYAEKIPVSGAVRTVAGSLGLDPLEFAAGGGEDYELLFTAPPGGKVRAARIGEVTRSRGLMLVSPDGEARAVEPSGYRHFG